MVGAVTGSCDYTPTASGSNAQGRYAGVAQATSAQASFGTPTLTITCDFYGGAAGHVHLQKQVVGLTASPNDCIGVLGAPGTICVHVWACGRPARPTPSKPRSVPVASRASTSASSRSNSA